MKTRVLMCGSHFADDSMRASFQRAELMIGVELWTQSSAIIECYRWFQGAIPVLFAGDRRLKLTG